MLLKTRGKGLFIIYGRNNVLLLMWKVELRIDEIVFHLRRAFQTEHWRFLLDTISNM